MNIGLRFRELREKAGISQQELANRLGQVRQAVVRFESAYHQPTCRVLAEYCDAIGVSLAEFFQSNIPQQYATDKEAEIHSQLQELLESDSEIAQALTLVLSSCHLAHKKGTVKQVKSRKEQAVLSKRLPQ